MIKLSTISLLTMQLLQKITSSRKQFPKQTKLFSFSIKPTNSKLILLNFSNKKSLIKYLKKISFLIQTYLILIYLKYCTLSLFKKINSNKKNYVMENQLQIINKNPFKDKKKLNSQLMNRNKHSQLKSPCLKNKELI
ncbi:transmembrane protein, putative (macronuclear) [Tetrahymena thermophila SB210]|uniref:Transmembrane protein, putative n=1 Tax=Tetrahymena thermophila (strain SB210) TaxID=312017 RepID=W7XCG3_TETTS|nr:transmembrane protein, putative [Tetrahymena thermophila SB210]EWS71451.1 transmembrane protein, putative [Tetrahymena thermophila SB210]|eukprot:XP_012656017.1 transmembrane protein, putative [Tetrahymena thermophila SB210]